MKKTIRIVALCLSVLTLLFTVQVFADASVQNAEVLLDNEQLSDCEQDNVQLRNSEIPSRSFFYPEIISEDEKRNSFISRNFDEEHTLYDLVFENEDHTRTGYFYSSPVKYYSSDGSIRDKSTLLYRIGSDTAPSPVEQSASKAILPVEKATQAVTTLVSKGIDASKIAFASLDNDIQTIFYKNAEDGVGLSFGARTVQMVPVSDEKSTDSCSLKGNDDSERVVSYAGVYGIHTAINYQPIWDGIKEEIILLSPTEQTEYSFHIILTGCGIIQDNDVFYLTDGETGKVIGRFNQIISYDAEGKTSIGSLSYQQGDSDREGVLTVSVDAQFLDSATYPVIIDPSMNVWNVYDGYSNVLEEAGLYNSSDAWGVTFDFVHFVGVNQYDSSVTGRILYRFPVMTSNYYGFHSFYPDQINSCQLHMKTSSVSSGCSLYTAPYNQSSWVAGTRICNANMYNDFANGYYEFSTKNQNNTEITADITQKCKLWTAYMQGLTTQPYANPNSGIIVICMMEDQESCMVYGFSSGYEPVPASTYLSIDYSLESYMGDFYINNLDSRAFLCKTNSSFFTQTGTVSSLGNDAKWTLELVDDGAVRKYAIHPYGYSSLYLNEYGSFTASYSGGCLWRFISDIDGLKIINDDTLGYLGEIDGGQNAGVTATDLQLLSRWRVARTSTYSEVTLSNLAVTELWGQENVPESILPKLITYNVDFAKAGDFEIIPSNTTFATGSKNGVITGLESKRSQNATLVHIPTGISKVFTFYTTIRNGTYFIRNVEDGKYLQPDDTDAPLYSSNNAQMEGWKLDGGNYQRWLFTHLGDGYFKIESIQSGKVLSVKSGYTNTSLEPLVQDAYGNYSRQKWKINWTTDSNYVLRPKTSEIYETDWCMKATAGSSDGLSVCQYGYTSDSNYKDEWILINCIYGSKPFRDLDSDSDVYKSINCQGYALFRNDKPQGWTNSVSNYLLSISSSTDYSDTIKHEVSVRTKQDFETWLTDNNYSFQYESTFSDNGQNTVLQSNQYRIVLRTGLNYVSFTYNGIPHTEEKCFDFHFWYQLCDGSWANKHGSTEWSEPVWLDYGITPESSSSTGWDLVCWNIYGEVIYTYHNFYDGDYFAYIITED